LDDIPEGRDIEAIVAKLGRIFTAPQLEQLYSALDEIISSGWGSVELVYSGKRLVGINVKRQIKVV